MSGFDRLARAYRWLEYLSFGRALERCRFHYLPQLTQTRSALLLGDGDGRFAERLLHTMLKASPRVPQGPQVTAVDASRSMLALLQARCAFASKNHLTTHEADLPQGLPEALREKHFDLVTTHFFLDCLSTAQVQRLVIEVKPLLTADAQWIVSEFAVPARGAMRLPAWIIVRALYLGFRLLTGLQAQSIPDYRQVLQAQGFTLHQQSKALAGLLTAELWRFGKSANR